MEVEKINKKIGISAKPEKIAELLSTMCLESVVDDNKFVKVTVPPTRAGKQRQDSCVAKMKPFQLRRLAMP